jgi:hypothetical protein
MSHISSIASLMCRRQCMLTELKELTAWLNVKELQQKKQQRQQLPRWLQNAYFKRNQTKLKHHRRNINTTVNKQTTFKKCRRPTIKRSKRDIAVTRAIRYLEEPILNDCLLECFTHIIIVITTFTHTRERIYVFFYSLTDDIYTNVVTAISLIFYLTLVVIYAHTFLLKSLTYNWQLNHVFTSLLPCIDYTSKERKNLFRMESNI